MEHIISLLDTDCQRLALAVIRGELEPADLLEKGLDLETEVRILDLVMEYAQVQYTKEELTKEEYVERFLEASKARSSLGRPEGYGYDIPAPSRPEQGHKPNRLSIGVGYRAWDDLDEGSLYQEIRFRPTYHDLLDSDKGYSRGAQIEFLSGVLRYYNSTDRVELERLDLLSIVSLAPRNRFFKPISWKVNTGLTQADLPGPHARVFSQHRRRVVLRQQDSGALLRNVRDRDRLGRRVEQRTLHRVRRDSRDPEEDHRGLEVSSPLQALLLRSGRTV